MTLQFHHCLSFYVILYIFKREWTYSNVSESLAKCHTLMCEPQKYTKFVYQIIIDKLSKEIKYVHKYPCQKSVKMNDWWSTSLTWNPFRIGWIILHHVGLDSNNGYFAHQNDQIHKKSFSLVRISVAEIQYRPSCLSHMHIFETYVMNG